MTQTPRFLYVLKHFKGFADERVAALGAEIAVVHACAVTAAGDSLGSGEVAFITVSELHDHRVGVAAACAYAVGVGDEKLKGIGHYRCTAELERVYFDGMREGRVLICESVARRRKARKLGAFALGEFVYSFVLCAQSVVFLRGAVRFLFGHTAEREVTEMHVVAQVCVGVKGCGIGKPEECLAYARRDTLHPRRVVHFGGVHEGLVHCRAHEVARRKVTRCTAERHERELAHFVCDLKLNNRKKTLNNFKVYYPKAKLTKIHTGETRNIGGAGVEFLYTPEDYYTSKRTFADTKLWNNTSLIFRVTIAGQKLMLLGDSQVDSNGIAVKMWVGYLKSDICQVAHHGGEGGTAAVYNAIDPTVALFTTSDEAFELYKKDAHNAHLLRKLHVKEVINCACRITEFPLPYTPGNSTVTDKGNVY